MSSRASWHAWTEREWRDEVAGSDEQLGRLDEDVEGFIGDIKDIAKMAVECTVEPLRAFAATLPQAMAFESQHWHDARRWSSRNKAWRYARRRWL